MIIFRPTVSELVSRVAKTVTKTIGPSSSTRDPLESPLWNDMAERYLGGRPAVFDDRVKVALPPVTEDQTQVPVTVDAREIGRADEILLIADLNPFPLTLRLEPVAAAAFVALRMKIEQGTPIRAAVRQGDLWHVGGRYLDAAGGGCSVPPVIAKTTDWKSLGNTRAEIWREPEGLRLRMRITHPMDNGMIPGVPVFFIETLDIADASGVKSVRLTLSEAVADNPTLTLLPDLPSGGDVLIITGRNTAGMDFSARVPIPPGTTASRLEERL